MITTFSYDQVRNFYGLGEIGSLPCSSIRFIFLFYYYCFFLLLTRISLLIITINITIYKQYKKNTQRKSLSTNFIAKHYTIDTINTLNTKELINIKTILCISIRTILIYKKTIYHHRYKTNLKYLKIRIIGNSSPPLLCFGCGWVNFLTHDIHDALH